MVCIGKFNDHGPIPTYLIIGGTYFTILFSEEGR